jgi:response regulator RpfG family c-di-GMP phosphodiesterase
VTTVDSGQAALEHLQANDVSVMLLDIRMPGMSGVDVVPQALDIDPNLAILMLTAVAHASSATRCLQGGAMDYLTKPVELTELLGAINRALRQRETMMQSREMTNWLHRELVRRGHEFSWEQHRQGKITLATLETMVNTLEAKNPYLVGHSARVAAFATTIADELGLPAKELEHIRIAARLHDLGKVGIREEVVNKEGPLTEEEYEHIREHSAIGFQILDPLPDIGPIAGYVRSHHEHWDGSGYPDGLRGEDIPLGARIVCAAEVYDALTSPRPYRDTFSSEAALERMEQLKGTVLDPGILEALEAALKRQRHMPPAEDPPATPQVAATAERDHGNRTLV